MTYMADEGTETASESSSNGVSGSSESLADARAAFLAMTGGEEAAESKSPSKETAKEPDDDSDLDESEDDADEEVKASADEDDDSDLDEEKDEDEEEKPDEKADPDTSKRLAAVQRTEKRMREQLRKDRAEMEAELEAKAKDYESRVRAEIDKWAPRIEAAEKFEKLSAQVNVHPLAALKALGFNVEKHGEHLSQVLYTLIKGKDDPKAAAAIAQIERERERDNKLDEMEKWRAAREEQDKKEREASEERERAAAADRELETYFGKVAKATSDKTPLAAAYIKANPTEARERMQVLAFRIAKEAGTNTLPKERDIVIALEKDRRRVLRELGIDPKSRGAAQASAAATDSKAKADKKPAKPAAKSDSSKPFTKEDFINGKFD